MKVRVVSQKYNPLLKRREVSFMVDHEETGGTPPRFEVRQRLASMLNVKLDLVYVKKILTKTGTMTAVGEANVYDSLEQAKFLEPEYIIARNMPPEEAQKEE